MDCVMNKQELSNIYHKLIDVKIYKLRCEDNFERQDLIEKQIEVLIEKIKTTLIMHLLNEI